MKLYIEEQVKNAIQIVVMDKPITYNEVLEKLKPIKLPSDEEMKKILDSRSDEYASGYYGAINMIEEQIK